MPVFQARTAIDFPNLADYLPTILDSFSAHNMTITAGDDGHAIASPYGHARLWSSPGLLLLSAQSSDAADFNRLKHELSALIGFVTRPENLVITWTGDHADATLPADLRVLTVHAVQDMGPRLRRITFSGTDLDRYGAPDQIHCRLLFQAKGTSQPQWPLLDDNGQIRWPAAGQLASRIFTIRRIDVARGRLEIDFVIHGGHGPGATWAAQAGPGDIVGILGPAAFGPKSARSYLLVGDETGLPGIARILECLPATATGNAIIEIDGAADRQSLTAPPGIRIHWLHRDGRAPGTTDLLIDAVRALAPRAADEDLFCWIGAEYSAFRAIRGYLRDDIGLPAARVIAFSHWRRGMSEDDIVKVGISAVLA